MNNTQQLIDEMVAKGYEVGIDYDINAGWEAIFANPNVDEHEEWSSGRTMQEAVNNAYDIAMLKAMTFPIPTDASSPSDALDAINYMIHDEFSESVNEAIRDYYKKMEIQWGQYILGVFNNPSEPASGVRYIPVPLEYGNERDDIETRESWHTRECEHEYKQYVGLTEQYQYCTKCNRKEAA